MTCDDAGYAHSDAPIIELPAAPLPNAEPESDLKALAESMTDAQMRALVIQNFRMLNEIIGFVRMAAQTLETLGTLGPLQSRLAGSVVPPEAMAMAKQQAAATAALRGDGLPIMNRAQRRAAK